jgi:4-hydroxy-3-methylbut-2-enyl diphosphate reductase
MKITLAQAMGTCFGVQDAIDAALDEQYRDRLTIVGQLVHNPQAMERLKANGVKLVERDQIDRIDTPLVMITAHGASDRTKQELAARGFDVIDATCPLVVRLHKLARFLEREGYFPVVVGDPEHVEVRGVVGNLRACAVIHDPEDVPRLAGHRRIGIVSQTTNRLEMVRALVEHVRRLPDVDEVRFIDTICQPVKDRQEAIHQLLAEDIDVGVIVGGYNSANTRKLYEMIRGRGIDAHHIERAEEVQPAWFAGKRHCGITAGTSTPQDVIEAVTGAIRDMRPAPTPAPAPAAAG